MNIEFQTFSPKTPFTLDYQFYTTQVGFLLVVSWGKALVYIAFSPQRRHSLQEAQARFPKAQWRAKETPAQKQFIRYIENPQAFKKAILVVLAGSSFQIKVWKALSRVPFASTCFYSDLAKALGQPTAVRAVASAVAKNPLAILIPCHRVLPRSGGIGNYHWGTKNKSALLTWERLFSQK